MKVLKFDYGAQLTESDGGMCGGCRVLNGSNIHLVGGSVPCTPSDVDKVFLSQRDGNGEWSRVVDEMQKLCILNYFPQFTYYCCSDCNTKMYPYSASCPRTLWVPRYWKWTSFASLYIVRSSHTSIILSNEWRKSDIKYQTKDTLNWGMILSRFGEWTFKQSGSSIMVERFPS